MSMTITAYYDQGPGPDQDQDREHAERLRRAAEIKAERTPPPWRPKGDTGKVSWRKLVREHLRVERRLGIGGGA